MRKLHNHRDAATTSRLMMLRWLLMGLTLLGGQLLASCSNGVGAPTGLSASAEGPTVVPGSMGTVVITPTLQPTAAPSKPVGQNVGPIGPATLVAPTAAAQLTVDMDAIFPPGKGRALVLNNCLNCHTFVRFVVGRRTTESWAFVKRKMRPQVPRLSDSDVDTLFAYLQENFDNTKPEPNLPDWVRKLW